MLRNYSWIYCAKQCAQIASTQYINFGRVRANYIYDRTKPAMNFRFYYPSVHHPSIYIIVNQFHRTLCARHSHIKELCEHTFSMSPQLVAHATTARCFAADGEGALESYIKYYIAIGDTHPRMELGWQWMNGVANFARESLRQAWALTW